MTTPVQVGFVVDSGGDSAASSLGASSGSSFSTRSAADALVANVNAHGGLGGRKINPVFYSFDYQGDYSRQYQAACELFTTDNRVAAVWSLTQAYNQSFETCLARRGAVHVNGSYATGDAEALTTARSLVSTGGPTVDRRMTAVIKGLSGSGYLTRSSKIGVIIESCPENTRAFKRTVTPLLSMLGLTLSDSVTTDCVASFSQAGAAASDLSSAVLRFNQRRVDRILMVTNFEAVLTLLFSNAAEAQAYRPGYALSSASAPAQLGPQLPAAQAANLHGVGWVPAADVTTPTPGPAGRHCFEEFRARGLSAQSATDRYTLSSLCDYASLLDRVLTATRGASGTSQMTAAVDALGMSFAGSMVLGERTLLSSRRHDAPAQGRPWSWSGGCGCSSYQGSPFDI